MTIAEVVTPSFTLRALCDSRYTKIGKLNTRREDAKARIHVFAFLSYHHTPYEPDTISQSARS